MSPPPPAPTSSRSTKSPSTRVQSCPLSAARASAREITCLSPRAPVECRIPLDERHPGVDAYLMRKTCRENNTLLGKTGSCYEESHEASQCQAPAQEAFGARSYHDSRADPDAAEADQ